MITIYGLKDPREDEFDFFYIGISQWPKIRFEQHKKDRSSAAWERIQEICSIGLECRMEALRVLPTRQQALEYEQFLISQISGLVNRARYLPSEGE